jgi:predicted RNase H-like nuclease
MGPMSGERVLGVDACKAGWIGIVLSAHDPSLHFAARISDLVDEAGQDGPLQAIAIDMPIGLPDAGRRMADTLARQAVGPRRASVFVTPVRAALEAADHGSATAVSRRVAGEGISRQAFGLQTKILEVDRWVRRTRHRVVEVHPEASFAQIAGGPLLARKSTWAGAALRRQLLADAGIVLAGDLGIAGERAGVDDVLDAAAAGWTALRVARGQAQSLPDPPEIFSDHLACAIWI